jgi:hypothetical protein
VKPSSNHLSYGNLKQHSPIRSGYRYKFIIVTHRNKPFSVPRIQNTFSIHSGAWLSKSLQIWTVWFVVRFFSPASLSELSSCPVPASTLSPADKGPILNWRRPGRRVIRYCYLPSLSLHPNLHSDWQRQAVHEYYEQYCPIESDHTASNVMSWLAICFGSSPFFLHTSTQLRQ